MGSTALPSILALDIGNTRTAAAVTRGGRPPRMRGRVDVETSGLPGALRWAKLKKAEAEVAVCSSVVPPIERKLAAQVRARLGLKLLFLEKDFRAPLSVPKGTRSGIGPDRLAAACGALAVHRGGAVVVDFGSAVTVDLVTGDGHYHGGTIGPGVRTGLEGLAARCARLPRMKLGKPRRALGISTRAAMLSGSVIGAAGAVDRLIGDIFAEKKLELPVIATGGEAALVAPFSRRIGLVREHLTLEGLVRAFEDTRG